MVQVASSLYGQIGRPAELGRHVTEAPRILVTKEQMLTLGYTVGQVFGIGSGELHRTTRGTAPMALARQVAMYLAHVVFGLRLREVGQMFERDRTTVAHACGLVEDRRDDPRFDRALDLLELILIAMNEPREPLKLTHN